MSEYTTIDLLREEGVSTDLSDPQLLRLIRRASSLIDNWTHRWFSPRECVLTLDGSGADTIQVGPPIIAVSEVKILASDTVTITSSDEILDAQAYRVFNRHLTQQLTDPDDRNNPKLQFVNSWSGNRRSPNIWPSGWFPAGVMNVQITGIFGYTEWDGVTVATDGVTLVGKTPEIISAACQMLVVRDLLPLGDLEGRNEASLSSRTTLLRTRDQQIGYNSSAGVTNSGSSFGSGIAGNAELIAMLAPYCRPPTLGAV